MADALSDPIRKAFRARLLGAVDRMAKEASAETLQEALAAPTDQGALARVMAEQAATDAVRALEPLAAAIARGAEVKARLADAAGGFLSATACGRLLGISRAAVDKRRATGRLLALRIKGDWRYPAAQFHDGEAVEGIAEVLKGMADASPWSVLDFLLSPDPGLDGRSPLASLRRGEAECVRRRLAARTADAFA